MPQTLDSLLLFPREVQFAKTYFAEAARHLQDARILHRNKRYAGSITSSMKAVELGLKTPLYLYGARGWLESALQTHTVLTELSKSKIATLKFIDLLSKYDTTLIADIEALEGLVPVKQDVKKLEYKEAVNTEYPFFAFQSDHDPSRNLSLYSPGAHFSEDESKTHYTTALKLLRTLIKLSSEIKAWKTPLSRDL